jgi:hypothetical protein
VHRYRIWSLALRRDAQTNHAAVTVLRRALLDGDTIVISGIDCCRASMDRRIRRASSSACRCCRS